MQFHFACATHVGQVRTNNEDAVIVDPALGLAVLADGMGGYNAGEVASHLCCHAVHENLRSLLSQRGIDLRRAVIRALDAANDRILADAQAHPAHRGMATTAVVVLVQGARLTVGHVGDSRLYRLRQGQMAQITRDHSLVQEHVDAGLLSAEGARSTGYRNLVTRALGVAPWVEVEVAEHVVQPGDTYLLCSDGLSDMLTEAEMARMLRHAGPPPQAAEALIAAANAAGGRDNITVALIHCVPDGAKGSD